MRASKKSARIYHSLFFAKFVVFLKKVEFFLFFLYNFSNYGRIVGSGRKCRVS